MNMIDLDFTMILFFMDGLLFVLGFFMVLVGLSILAKKAFGDEVRALAATTSKLAQKGIADDIAGLVGNASALMKALQEMVKTARGIGVFLILFGGIFIASSILILIKYILA
jgi:ABC-type transport system involved in cytochrome c biogenesis permease subunit